jgi:hypothetical protein
VKDINAADKTRETIHMRGKDYNALVVEDIASPIKAVRPERYKPDSISAPK